jgi:carbamoyltransferase
MRVIGLSAYYHDSAAVILQDGKIISAAHEERFTRVRHDERFPHNALNFCLKDINDKNAEIDLIAFYENPTKKLHRIIKTALDCGPSDFNWFRNSLGDKSKKRIFLPKQISSSLSIHGFNRYHQKNVRYVDHHLSHAASAFYPSPFNQAAVLTIDGVGEFATTSLFVGDAGKLELIDEIFFPHSLGLLYSSFTEYLGFKVNSGEYRVMGLAPYGTPNYVDKIYDYLMDVKEDGSFQLNLDYFDYVKGFKMVNEKFEALFEQPRRLSNQPLSQFHMDMAASIQSVLDERVLSLARNAAKKTGFRNLCLAGGVALNCVSNSKILKGGVFDNLWIQPAAGDAGGALGAALETYYENIRNKKIKINKNASKMGGALLGPSWSNSQIEKILKTLGAEYTRYSFDELIEKTVQDIVSGSVVGWFQDRMEFGPRALGARSIIADPRDENMQEIINQKIKFRESFRPFAPAVLLEKAHEWFDFEKESPYMLFVSEVKESCRIKNKLKSDSNTGFDRLKVKNTIIPAVTHVDFSARLQTVKEKDNPKFYKLLQAFFAETGCPILVNTSFNVRGEPIVCSPEDAFKCFMATDMDTLVVGNLYLQKTDQNPGLKQDYSSKFDPN